MNRFGIPEAKFLGGAWRDFAFPTLASGCQRWKRGNWFLQATGVLKNNWLAKKNTEKTNSTDPFKVARKTNTPIRPLTSLRPTVTHAHTHTHSFPRTASLSNWPLQEFQMRNPTWVCARIGARTPKMDFGLALGFPFKQSLRRLPSKNAKAPFAAVASPLVPQAKLL